MNEIENGLLSAKALTNIYLGSDALTGSLGSHIPPSVIMGVSRSSHGTSSVKTLHSNIIS